MMSNEIQVRGFASSITEGTFGGKVILSTQDTKPTPRLLCDLGSLKSYFGRYGRVRTVKILKDGDQVFG